MMTYDEARSVDDEETAAIKAFGPDWERLMEQRARDILQTFGIPISLTNLRTIRAHVETIDLNARLDVYRTMCMARTDKSTELPEPDIMSEERMEALAIRAALGNNGGAWATHYTEEQKAHWRQFVRDLGEEFYEAGRASTSPRGAHG